MGEPAAPGFDDSPSFTVNFTGAFQTPRPHNTRESLKLKGILCHDALQGSVQLAQKRGQYLNLERQPLIILIEQSISLCVFILANAYKIFFILSLLWTNSPVVTFCQQSTKIHPVDNDGTEKIGQFSTFAKLDGTNV